MNSKFGKGNGSLIKETTNGQVREESYCGQSLQSNCQNCLSSQWCCTVAVVILDAGGGWHKGLSLQFVSFPLRIPNPSFQISGSWLSELAEYVWQFSSVKYEATVVHVSYKASLSFWEKILAQGIENKVLRAFILKAWPEYLFLYYVPCLQMALKGNIW